MVGIFILSVSLVLQAIAAGIAVSLIRETKQRLTWSLITAALVLMFVRRAITFYDVVIGGDPQALQINAELVALVISAAFAAGILGIRVFFRSLQTRKNRVERKEASLAEAQNIAKVGNWEWDLVSNSVWWSEEYSRLIGYEAREVRPSLTAFLERVHPEDCAMVKEELDSARRERQPYDIEFRLLLPDESVRVVHAQGAVVYDDSHMPVRMRGTLQDITKRKRAEELVTRFGHIVENSTNEILIFDSQTLHFIHINRRARENLGYTDEELSKMTPVDIKPSLTADYAEELLKPLREGRAEQIFFETIHRRKDGTTYDVEVRLQLSHAETPPVFFAIIDDITERKRAAAELRQKEELFRALIEQAPDMIFLLDANATVKFASPSVQRVMGYTPDEVVGQQWFEFAHPDDLAMLREINDQTIRNREGMESAEFRFRRLDGSWCILHSVARNLLDNPVVEAVVVNAREITDRVIMEDQLRHAHKMEAVGQLTGGIAHDFNNLLSVIIGNLDVLAERARGNPELQNFLKPASKAAQRGALLTERLLAFSRKQSLRPRVVDLNDLVGFMSDMLPRTLGETVSIEIVRGAGLWPCEIDPVQLENAILNIAINARDAMPNGGKLTIETANARLDDEYAAAQADVAPGEYVVLSLSDTGSGMPPDVLEHVFEPFFTTKDVGKGTGLGLSMVYGFAKQSGGHVTIYSEPGQGTTVRLYLPRAKRAATRERQKPAGEPNLRARGETVLVVEDDPDVRSLAVTLLGDLGYSVFEAGNARAALDLLEEHPRVNLILTDMVMPGGMNGRDLALEAEKVSPGIRIVYMSGYTETAATRGGKLRHDEIMLQKPFRRKELARRLREALDADHDAQSGS